MTTHVLVTGGAGYLGSVLCEHLLNAGYQVTAVDNLMYGQHSLFHLCAEPRFEFVFGDVRNEGLMVWTGPSSSGTPHPPLQLSLTGLLNRSRRGTSQSVTRKYDCGLSAEPGSPGDLADKILILYHNRDLAQRLGANARQAALQCDCPLQVHAYYDLFRDLAGFPACLNAVLRC